MFRKKNNEDRKACFKNGSGVILALATVAILAFATVKPASAIDCDLLGAVYAPDATEADQGATGSGTTAKAYIDALGSDAATLIFRHDSGNATTTYVFSTSEIIPSNIHVLIEEGAILSIDSGKTLTINGAFNAGISQVFGGSGEIKFGTQNIQRVEAHWWGVVGDNSTDNTSAMQKAIDCAYSCQASNGHGIEVKLKPGIFLVTRITLFRGVWLCGSGIGKTYLKQKSGETSEIIIDDASNGGVNIRIGEMTISGNSNNTSDALISLGFGSTQFGTGSRLDKLMVRDTDGIGLKVNGNVAYIDDIESWSCGNGALYLTGAGNMLKNLVFSSCSPVPFTIHGHGNMISNVFHEGDCSGAVIKIDDSMTNNSIVGIYAYIYSGNAVDSIVEIGNYSYGNTIESIKAIIGTSGGSSVSNGLVYDKSYPSASRKEWGEIYGTEIRFVHYYKSGRNYQITNNISGPPSEGTYIASDWYINSTGSPAGRPRGFYCMSSGTPGTWAPMGVIAYHINKTSNYTIDVSDNGKRFSNYGASGTVTFTLPPAASNLEIEIIKVSNQTILITPNGSERINTGAAGASYTMGGVGHCVRLAYLAPGQWVTIRNNGL